MHKRLANRSDAESLARHMRDTLPGLADKERPKTASGRTEWTRAVWQYFDSHYREAHGWEMYPATKPVKGRVAGEFMTDFALFERGRGYRIACEGQWGANLESIDWAFDKLRSVKAEIKILLFEREHEHEPRLPNDVDAMVREYLAECGNHHADHEFYLFLQFSGRHAKLFIWQPKQIDGYTAESVNIEPLR